VFFIGGCTFAEITALRFMGELLQQEFIIATTKLYCDLYGIEMKENSEEWYLKVLEKTELPHFVKTKVVKEKKEGEEEEKQEELSPEEVKKKKEYEEKVIKDLIEEVFKGSKVIPVEFEKDLDENFHMDFVTSASNVRAKAYGIPEADKHRTKGIAGNIIPAMITTTALITGLVGFEIIKLVQKKKREDFRNTWNNIGFNTIQSSEPSKADLVYLNRWSVWDTLMINEGKDITLEEFVEKIKEKYSLPIVGVNYGKLALFILKMDDQLAKAPVAGLCQHLSGEKFDVNRKFIELNVSAYIDGKVESVPSVRYQFRTFQDEKQPLKKKK